MARIREEKDSVFAGMTARQKKSYKRFLEKAYRDPEMRASDEYQHAYQAIEDYWNIEGKRTEDDLRSLLVELDCVEDSLEEIRDDMGWSGYDEMIREISDLARKVGVYWPSWLQRDEIEDWEIVGPDVMVEIVEPKKKGNKMKAKKEVERRNVWVYQPAVSLENSPIEIRVTEPGSKKKLLGRLYISKGGLTWCNRKQRFNNKVGYRWEAIAEMLGE